MPVPSIILRGYLTKTLSDGRGRGKALPFISSPSETIYHNIILYLFRDICSILYCLCYYWDSLVAQLVKNLPAVQETRVQSLGWKDPLEKEMATHSSILAWEISWTEEPGGQQSMRLQRVGHD